MRLWESPLILAGDHSQPSFSPTVRSSHLAPKPIVAELSRSHRIGGTSQPAVATPVRLTLAIFLHGPPDYGSLREVVKAGSLADNRQVHTAYRW